MGIGVNPRRFCFALAVFAFGGAAVRADDLRTLGGKTVSGTLSSITSAEVTMMTEAGPVVTPLAQVLAVDLRKVKGIAAGTRYSDVRLLDDSNLHCQAVAFKGNQVDMTLTLGSQVSAPLSHIMWLVQEAENSVLRKKFDDVLSDKNRRDRIVVLRDMDLNALPGTLGDVDAAGAKIQFRRDGFDAVGIPLERLHGLIFYRPEVSTETPVCRVHDIDGSMLVATKLTFGEGGLAMTTSGGGKVQLKREMLARLDFNTGKLTYLSDLEPAKVIERHLFSLRDTPYRKDTNLAGEPIVLKEPHAKGLSLHAHTELFYNLEGKYKEFKAIIGVDARTDNDQYPSQAVVTIYCDGERRFSESVSLKAPRPVALNIKDVNNLRIVVSGRNFTNMHDHATLADARVSQ